MECSVSDIKLIVGLGNPGDKYAGTRHNVGFDIVDMLADELGTDIRTKKFASLFGSCSFDGKKILLLKPQTYMNLSGQAVATVMGFYKLQRDSILVITDDMALEPGRIRLRPAGSAGGHNGLADIISKLGSNEFARLRVGIGASDCRDSRDYVLSRPGPEDRELIEKSSYTAVKAVKCWMQDGIDKAMSEYNGWMANARIESNKA